MTPRRLTGARAGPVLVLGGTGLAVNLVRAAAARWGARRVLYSLAGRTSAPRLPDGPVRQGGFGGAEGLASFLRDTDCPAVIDATHPYAAQISANAAAACSATGTPRLVLGRSPWQAQAGDDWRRFPSVEAMAEALPDAGDRALHTLGADRVAPFLGRPGLWLLMRVAEAPVQPPLPGDQLLVQRGPFTLAQEDALIRARAITVVLSRDSGGPATAAKLTAARHHGLPVLLLERPPPPPGPLVTDIAAALAWLGAHMGDGGIPASPDFGEQA